MGWRGVRTTEAVAAPETRDQSYTDVLVSYIQSQASGGGTDPRSTAALEIATGLYGRAFASADVSPNAPATHGITPPVLELIGRELIRTGEAVFLIDVDGSGAILRPVSWWSVAGGSDPASWEYILTMPAPSESESITVKADRVVHVRYGCDPREPWRGRAPWQNSLNTSNLAAILELRLSEEVSAPVGNLLPVPDDASEESLGQLRTDIGGLKGKTAFAPTTRGGYGAGMETRPQDDWKQRRIGATPPPELDALRSSGQRSLLAACGVPVELVEVGQGTGSREAYRRFLHSSVRPIAKLVEHELREKLDSPDLGLSFDSLMASDIAGKARAFQSMVGGGMDVAKAATLAGLIEAEE